MAKPDGRIEKGQRLSTAISARAWNRAQDAADIVLGARPGVQAGDLSQIRLPCQKAILSDKGFFGEVRILGNLFINNPPINIAPTVPASINSAGAFSFDEAVLLNVFSSETQECGAGVDADRAFAICISNDENRYALSGLAITRVRVFNYYHRYARLPQAYSEMNASDYDNVIGCLDSCFYGPAQIIGYYTNRQLSLRFNHYSKNPPLTWPNHEFRWALVKF
jgi:hypothetical protein